MKTFIYTATDVKGNTLKNQRMQAENVNEFLDKIHEKGLFCSAYKEAKGDEGKKLHKFKTKELSYDCRQMSAMMSSAASIPQENLTRSGVTPHSASCSSVS